MRKLKAKLLAGIVAMWIATPAVATPGLYNISFTLSVNSPMPTAGSFIYDPDGTGSFTAFTVEWDNIPFILTDAANGLTGTVPAACGTPTGAKLSFLVLSQDSCLTGSTFAWQGVTAGGNPPDKEKFQFVWNGLTIESDFMGPPCPTGATCPLKNPSGGWTLGGPGGLVPEPATLALLGLGLAGLALLRRRRSA